ncbi:hypothetical protein [Henriciella aquimarina]|uniref:hypothetical protein n=1 Tax=Henriciella aquimarina TaxID=545261 RepID=UPI000A009330|nr:hypothetical protein [Henriciella aquimarina]
MPEFGANGAVTGGLREPPRDYAGYEKPKIRRVILACFLCGIAASISVALVAGLGAFAFSTVMAVLDMQPPQFEQASGLMAGMLVAVMMAAFNWYLFFIVLPVTWLVLGLSLGRFPHRGIARAAPYYRWGVIWGAVLVGGTTGTVGFMMQPSAGAGALVTGLLIGATAGLVCAGLFRLIVRPAKQIAQVQADVF